jgi:DNA-binding response OmpR family regulator
MTGQILSGQILSHYEVQEELGRGGMGRVYKARDLRLQRTTALKLLLPGQISGEQSRLRIACEARAASALNHPNIVIIYEIDESDGVHFIAMEYVEGKSLRDSISAGGLHVNRVLDYGIQIAGALEAAHAAGVIHCDLKPGNIMIGSAGGIKVLDFGLAKLHRLVTAEEDATLTLETRFGEGAIQGTMAYIAPEQAQGKPADTRTDIFSFGATLYEMATGTPAFHRTTPAVTLAAILRDHPPAVTQLAPAAPKGLEYIIAWCLEKDPACRAQRIQDVKLALEELKRETTVGGAAVSHPLKTAGSWRTFSSKPRTTDEAMTRILIVEDAPGIALGLEDDLRLEGYDIELAADGEIASRRAREEPFDLILLDIMLPRKNGFDVCREVRRAGIHTPILMLTAKGQEAEKIMGLDLGADDYVTKPFSPHELRARVRALLRRGAQTARDSYSFGEIEVDFGRAELRRAGRPVETTPLEFKLLTTFLRNPGKLLSRSQLLDEVWGHGIAITDRVVDNQIVALRKKIEINPAQPQYLISVRGMGYRFEG